MRQGPWTGRYPAAAAMVIFALVPYLALSAALAPITPIIAKDLHMSLQAMSLTSGMANAGYAVGTVLAVLFGPTPSAASDAGAVCRAAGAGLGARGRRS